MKRLSGYMMVFVIGLFLTLSLYNCGGGGSSTSSSSSSGSITTSSTVSGLAFDGPVIGAVVKAYKIFDNGSIDFSTPLATTVTDPSGNYSFTMNYTGPVYIVVSGGEYYSPIDNKTVVLKDNLTTALPKVDDNTTASVTPLTTVAAEYAKQVGMTKENIEAANHTVAQAFLGDNVSIAQVLPAKPNSSSGSDTSKIYGAISEAIDNVSTQDIVSSIQQGKLSQTVANTIKANITKVTDNNTINGKVNSQIDNATSSGFTPPPVKNAKLIVKTGFEGLYVSIDDPKTLKPIKTKITNSNGVVVFDNLTGPFVTTTVAFTPDFIVHKDLLMWYAIKAIQFDNDSYDIQKAFEEQKVSVKDLESLIGIETNTMYLDNVTISKADIESYDSNGDGYLDKNELYSLMLNFYDKNKDGKLEFKEISKEINVQVIINNKTPVGSYNTMLYYFHWKHIYEPPKKVITLHILNIPPQIEYEIKWPILQTDIDETAERIQTTKFTNSDNTSYDNKTIQIPLYCLQNDNTYSAIITDNETDDKYDYILNSLSNNITIDLSKEKTARSVSISPNISDNETHVAFYGLNRGASYLIGETASASDVEVANIPFEKIFLTYDKTIQQSQYVTIAKEHDILINKLPDTINSDNFTYMSGSYDNVTNIFIPDNVSNKQSYVYVSEGVNYYNYSKYVLDYWYRFGIHINSLGEPPVSYSIFGPNSDYMSKIKNLVPSSVYNYIQEVDNAYIDKKSDNNTNWHSYGYGYLDINPDSRLWFGYDYNNEHNQPTP